MWLPEFSIPAERGGHPFYHGGGGGHHLNLFNALGLLGFIDGDKLYLKLLLHQLFPVGIPFVQEEALVIPELLHVGSAAMDTISTC